MQAGTLVQERRNRGTVLGTGVAGGLIGINVATIPWLVTTLVGWSTSDIIDKNPFFYLILASIFLCPLVIAIMLRLVKSATFLKLLTGGLIQAGLGGQLVMSWLVYARFHALFPFGTTQLVVDGAPLQTGWLATDGVPIILFAAWACWMLLLVVPSLFAYIIATNAGGGDVKPGLHLALAITGLAFGLRWGGPLSAPLHNLVFVACLLPAMVLALGKTGWGERTPERRHFPVFSTIGTMALLGFWLSLPLVHAGGQLATGWTWLAMAAASSALLLASLKVPGWSETRPGKLALAIAWLALAGVSACMVLANVNAWFSLLLLVWTSAGLALASFMPEMLVARQVVARKPIGSRVFFAGLLFFLGIILAYIVNLYDPLSSYVSLGILGLFFVMSFMVFCKKKDWAASDRVYGIAAIITSCTILLAPAGLVLAFVSLARKEKKGIAIASLVISIVVIALLAVAIVLLADTIAGLF